MIITRGSESNILRMFIPVTGLTNSTAGLKVASICDNEATGVVHDDPGTDILDITTIGTYASMAGTECRFKAVGASFPFLYEIQLPNARFAISGSKRLIVTVSTGAAASENWYYEIDLDGIRAHFTTVNDGVKDSSIKVPHTTNLT